ncbi:pathogenicity island protein [Alkalicoccus saliphilus]|uniref:Pathogenicity island protein n=1 Tax=Alkalicoccus saliphilus TaxID=200989 RepID=A0A2T4U2L7_9BACI|nr:pathogenicity island protein [Alkalicoccus saliphilus]PTL37647.1 pathogenicity island protein [Alkalicoccus saliphilus]
MNQTKVKNKILDYIQVNDNTSYVEIEKIFEEEGFSWQGEFESTSVKNRNVIYWSGWNEEAYHILEELQEQNLIKKEVVPPFVYFIDGKTLRMPIVKSGAEYKTPHWLPIAFTAVEGGTAS